MSYEYSEDKLVQETTAAYFAEALGWESILAYNDEVLGPSGTLGRLRQSEVVLTRYLRQKLEEFNPGLPEEAYEQAIKAITATSTAKTTLQLNQEKYALYRDGVPVTYRAGGGTEKEVRLQVFDFNRPEKNHFLIIRELWIKGPLYRRRPDIIGFVNGIPLLFIELKRTNKNIRVAYEKNLSDYKTAIPALFEHNALVMLSNGREGRIGSITSRFGHFSEWKRLAEEDEGVVDFQTMLIGLGTRQNFMDIFENFILFDSSRGATRKILARNHQYLGANRAFEAARQEAEKDPTTRAGKLGVFWHTQGSGKSYAMVFLTRKIHRKLSGKYTFVILTDRKELDRQIYQTYVGVGAATEPREQCQAQDGKHLEKLLQEDHAYIFSLIHKFNQADQEHYSDRPDIIVITDEAHRTQYGRLARNMRQALPHAAFIGFTGTPLIAGPEDELTKETFGDYVSVYDFHRSVLDGATVPLYYDNRGEKLGLTTEQINADVAQVLEEYDPDEDQAEKLRRVLYKDYLVITADDRLERIAQDFVQHYLERWQTGKAMLVCIDKITCVKMYNLIDKYWQQAIKEQQKRINRSKDEQEEIELLKRRDWMQETEYAVIVSEEQNEVQTFQNWGLDIIPHRQKMKSRDMEEAFKKDEHPFRIAIVCAMWLTGFDVESLATMYIDKPMKGHTLIQAIARANRVKEGKNNGLIVDYSGILKSLRRALATYATGKRAYQVRAADYPAPDISHLLKAYAGAIEACRDYLAEVGFDLQTLIDAQGFDKIGKINDGAEAVNANDTSRARYMVLARDVFQKEKALSGEKGRFKYVHEFNAIEAIYQEITKKDDDVDISLLLSHVHQAVTQHIQVQESGQAPGAESGKVFDISNIDFERLKAEFSRSSRKNSTVQSLKQKVEQQLKRMVEQNPQRMNLYERYQQIIAAYNKETDRATIEQTFAELLDFIETLSEEEQRAVREGLTEEYLAVFDLLCQNKNNLSTRTRNRVKEVAHDLVEAIKAELAKLEDWREKETTRAQVQTFIFNYLWDENTGLPVDAYQPDEVEVLSKTLFQHVYTQYPNASGSVYSVAV
jgi:type I restriction enzyme R subunit